MTFRAATVWIARHADRIDLEDPAWFKTAAHPHDPPLSARGRLHAQRLAHHLRDEDIGHLFSSPFLRAMETADAIAQVLDLRIKIDGGFSEWLNREWFAAPPRLLSQAQRGARFPRIDRAYAARGAAHHGESGEDALRRAGTTAVRIASEFDGRLLIVGHGASVLGATAGLLGRTSLAAIEATLPDMPYACLTKLERHAETWQLRFACDTAHLD